jgi:hypothetical protein
MKKIVVLVCVIVGLFFAALVLLDLHPLPAIKEVALAAGLVGAAVLIREL